MHKDCLAKVAKEVFLLFKQEGDLLMNQKSAIRTKFIVRIGMLGALSFIIMLLEFPIGFAEFLKLDFSDIVAMIGGITMGPLAAVAIQFIKNLLKVVIISKTAGIGELANLIVGIAYVLPATIIYHKVKSNKGLIAGLIAGSITMVVIACLANFFILLPLYWSFLSEETMTVASRWNFIQVILLPFNLIKAIIITILTFTLHLSMKPLYKHFAK